MPVAVLMAITTGFQVPGYLFKLQGFNLKTSLIALVLFTPIFMAAGYVWGLVVYRFSKGRRL